VHLLFVLIKLWHCGHLALSRCLTLHAKLVFCLVKIEGLRAAALCSVIECSAVLRGSLFGVSLLQVVVCQLDFNNYIHAT